MLGYKRTLDSCGFSKNSHRNILKHGTYYKRYLTVADYGKWTLSDDNSTKNRCKRSHQNTIDAEKYVEKIS